MSKIISLFLLLFLFTLSIAQPKIALAADCPLNQVTVNPTEPEVGKPFTISLISDKITPGKDTHVKIRTEPITSGGTLADVPAKGEDGFVIFNIDKTLPPKDYRAVFYEGSLSSNKEICQSIPFTIKPIGGSSSGGYTQPTDSCTLNATVKNNKLALSGTGTIKSGEYMPYLIIQGTTASPLTPNLSINSEGAFGPYSYDVPKNLQGGVSTIGVRHQYYTDVICTTSANLPNTTTNAKVCPKQGENFNSNKHLNPELCSSAGGDPCGSKEEPGFKTAIGCIHTTPKALVSDILKFATGIGGGLAFMMMLLGAFQMLTSGGNPQNLQGGKDVLQNAIIGLLFIIFSILLMKIIGIDILNIPGFG